MLFGRELIKFPQADLTWHSRLQIGNAGLLGDFYCAIKEAMYGRLSDVRIPNQHYCPDSCSHSPQFD
jgi:hypothetical protein